MEPKAFQANGHGNPGECSNSFRPVTSDTLKPCGRLTIGLQKTYCYRKHELVELLWARVAYRTSQNSGGATSPPAEVQNVADSSWARAAMSCETHGAPYCSWKQSPSYHVYF